MNEFWQRQLIQIGNFTLTPAKLPGVVVVLLAARLFLFFLKIIWLSSNKLTESEKNSVDSLYLIVKYLVRVLVFSVIISSLGFIVASFAASMVGPALGCKIFQQFKNNGIIIPFPQRDVHIIQSI